LNVYNNAESQRLRSNQPPLFRTSNKGLSILIIGRQEAAILLRNIGILLSNPFSAGPMAGFRLCAFYPFLLNPRVL
jgi:hypothetical protein